MDDITQQNKVCSGRGGARPGAGRPPVETKEVKLRLSPEDHELVKNLGMSSFIRSVLEDIRKNKTFFTLQLSQLTDEQKDAFYEGFVDAGGPEAVPDDPCPWGTPWAFEVEIRVTGATPEAWGQSWWLQNRAEISAQTPIFVFEKTEDGWDFEVYDCKSFCWRHIIADFNVSRFKKGLEKVEGVTYFMDRDSAERFAREVFAGKPEEDEMLKLVRELELELGLL